MNNTLRHDGVKGMRWGVRRTPEQLGHMKEIANHSKTISSEINRHVSKPKPNAAKAKSMSDQELRERVARLSLEKQYSTLTSENVSRGRKFAMKAFDIAGSVLTVAGSALTIAQLIRQIEDGK